MRGVVATADLLRVLTVVVPDQNTESLVTSCPSISNKNTSG